MSEVGKKIVEGLKQFAEDLKNGQVDKYRRTKIVKMDDGSFELWRQQKGVDPETGEMWLTPEMEKEAADLAKQWEKEDGSKADRV